MADRSQSRDHSIPVSTSAGFEHWLARSAPGHPPLFPSVWRSSPGLRIDQPSTVGVLAHVQSVAHGRELVEQLAAMPVDYDLVVTNVSGTSLGIRPDAPAGGRRRNVRVLP